MLALYTRHIKNCATIRRLLRQNPSENLETLYWYDLRLADAVALSGIARVLFKRLFSRGDKLSQSWGMESIYFSPPPEVSGNTSRASVWHCEALQSKPWFDEPSEVRSRLLADGPEVIAEYQRVAAQIDTHPDNEDYVHSGKWNGLFLSGAKGAIDPELARECPVTAKLLQEVPVCRNFGFVAYSQLLAGTHLAAHVGSSNLRMRYHLGVDIPEPDQVKIRVGKEWRLWQQGGVMAFDDSYNHEVIHSGEKSRTILMIDVWHPGLSETDVDVLSHPVFSEFGR